MYIILRSHKKYLKNKYIDCGYILLSAVAGNALSSAVALIKQNKNQRQSHWQKVFTLKLGKEN